MPPKSVQCLLRCNTRWSSSSPSTSRPSASATSSSSSSPSSSSPRRPSKELVHAALTPKTFSYTQGLSRHLARSLILHEPGRFVILQKPYGVSCMGKKQKDGGIFKDSVHNRIDEKGEFEDDKIEHLDGPVTISDCLPILSNIFSEPQLMFCTGLKRYLSGPLILPANKKDFENLKRSLYGVSTGTTPEFPFHYGVIAICANRPVEDEGEVHGYATFQPVGKHKEYIFVEGKATRRAKTGKYAVEGSVAYRVLDTQHGCALVNIECGKFARHLPRLVMAHLNAPILGDDMYLRRMFDVDGEPVGMEPARAARSNAKKWLPSSLLSHLSLPSSSLPSFPLFCHVYQTRFPRFGQAKREHDVLDLIASAPPPDHFIAMVDALGFTKALKAFWNERIEEHDIE